MSENDEGKTYKVLIRTEKTLFDIESMPMESAIDLCASILVKIGASPDDVTFQVFELSPGMFMEMDTSPDE